MGLPRVLRYALTGGLAAVVDIGGFAALALALPGVLLPAVLSFLAAAAVNYRASAGWVFGHDWRDAGRAARFLVAASGGLAVNAGATSLLATLVQAPPLAAKVAGVGLAFGVNFLLHAHWALRRPAGGAAQEGARAYAPAPGPAPAPTGPTGARRRARRLRRPARQVPR
jgi:putative flippase GtrA